MTDPARETVNVPLLPCPMSGHDADNNGPTQEAGVICKQIFAHSVGKAAFEVRCVCGVVGPRGLSEDAAIAAWNRRAAPRPSAAPDGSEREAQRTAVICGLRRWLEWDFEGSDREYAAGAHHVLNALFDDRLISLPPILPDQAAYLALITKTSTPDLSTVIGGPGATSLRAPQPVAGQGEVERLREALKPFAKAAELFVDYRSEWPASIYNPAAGTDYAIDSDDLLRALAALRNQPGEAPQTKGGEVGRG